MKKILSIILIASSAVMASAQDVHFSQMGNAPLILNPALAGVGHNMQAIANYRTQWNSVAQPFTTTAASLDVRANGNQRNKQGHLAFGINFFNDKAGSEQVSTTNINASIAYHAHIDNSNTISFALSPGFGQRSLDGATGRWASQYNGSAYDGLLPSGENLSRNKFGFFDVGAGVVFTSEEWQRSLAATSQKYFRTGLAFHHLTRPNYSFTESGEDQLPVRVSFFANGQVPIAETNVSIMPGIYYQRQRSASEFMLGTDVRYTLTEGSRVTGRVKESHVLFGVYYRFKDAAVIKAGLEYFNYAFGISYDVNVSTLSETAKSTSAIELFLRYRIPEGGNSRRL